MASLTIRLDDELYERLRLAAFQTRQPMSELIRAALLVSLPSTTSPNFANRGITIEAAQ